MDVNANRRLAKDISKICDPCKPDYSGCGERDCLYCTRNIAYAASLEAAEKKDGEMLDFLYALKFQSTTNRMFDMVSEKIEELKTRLGIGGETQTIKNE